MRVLTVYIWYLKIQGISYTALRVLFMPPCREKRMRIWVKCLGSLTEARVSSFLT